MTSVVRHVRTLTLACLLLSPLLAAAQPQDAAPQMSAEQQAMMEAWQKAATPGPQHAQLAEHFAGTWDVKMTTWMDPSAPPSVESGVSVDTAVLGNRQIETKYSGQFMGQAYVGTGFMGYNNVTGKYSASWYDNMSTGSLVSTGSYDPATKTYTFTAEMPDPMRDGAMTPIRETMRIVDADHHVFEMYETRDGKELRTMMIEYARKK